MAERNKNIFKRQIISFNPNFRIDTANPQMGLSGMDVYKIYGVTDNGDNQSSISLSSGGIFSIYNDRTIQISGGSKHEEGREDIIIIGNNGNVSITANGMVRIRGTSIMLEADEDIHLKAGRNIDLKSGSGRTLIQGNKIDITAQTGNLIDELGKGFLKSVFAGTYVGGDFLGGFISGVSKAVLNSVL
jgi:hypothetical protein